MVWGRGWEDGSSVTRGFGTVLYAVTQCVSTSIPVSLESESESFYLPGYLHVLDPNPACGLTDENSYKSGKLSAINFATSLTISPSDVIMKSKFCLGYTVSKFGHMSMISLYSCSLSVLCAKHSQTVHLLPYYLGR